MKCYFYGHNFSERSDQRNRGIISFVIPDIGVVYRTRFIGDRFECEYRALISLLEFVADNSEMMESQQLELLGDSAVVVYQVNGKMPVYSRLRPFYRTVEQFKTRFNFKVSWMPASLNRAAKSLPDLPPLKVEFNYEFYEAQNKTENRDAADTDSSSRLW